MSKDTHTHRGHCQYCLRLIAIDVTTGKLAKHGYTVEGGMFQGECPGSDVLSLHTDRSHTDTTIKLYEMKAANLRTYLANLESGADHPAEVAAGAPRYESHMTDEDIVRYWRFETRQVPLTTIDRTTGKPNGSKMIDQTVMLAWDDANAIQKRRGLICEISSTRHGAEQCARFAESMKQWAKEVHDDKMPAYRVKDLDEWAKVGDTVHAGGEKNGFDAKVEAVEMRDYTTRGWMRGGSTTVSTQHARITRPAIADTFHKNGSVKKKGRAAFTYWEAIRNLKPAKGSLIDRLKADNLL